MRGFSNTNLAKKLTMSAMAFATGAIIVMTTVVYLAVIAFSEDFLQTELDKKSRFIEKAFMEPLWTYDQEQIKELANSLLVNSKYSYVTAIRIQTSDSEIIFEKAINGSKDFQAASLAPHTKTRNIIINYKGDQKIGDVFLAMTNEGAIDAIRSQLTMILVSSLVLLFLVSQFVRYYFNQTLATPLNKILGQVQKIENEDYQSQQVEGLPEELQVVSNALNQTAAMIEKRNDDIRFYTNDLEKLVFERTVELENQMTQNLNTARLLAVGEMAADVAHEINNPLTVIDLHVNKLKKLEAAGHIAPELSVSINKIQMMILRITKIIKGLKSLSRDGNADPKVAFSIANMIEDVKTLVEMKIKSHEIKFEINLMDTSLHVVGREVQISQVLVNLIGNAIDAVIASTPESRWITLDIKEFDNHIYFYVTDCGPGISEELHEKIMRPFFTTKELNKGTGLGLSISKTIIEEHEGRLEYNRESQNTQFVFTLKKSNITQMAA